MKKPKIQHRFLNFRNEDSVPYKSTKQITKQFMKFFEDEIWPYLTNLHKGYKILQKKEIAARCVNHLITSKLTGRVVSDSRNTAHKEILLRKSVWDALVNSRFALMCRGSESSKKQTRYRAAKKLISKKELWELDFLEGVQNFHEETSLVLFRQGKYSILNGKKLPEEARKNRIPLIQVFEDIRDGKDEISQALEGVFGKIPNNDMKDSKVLLKQIERVHIIEDVLNEINEINFQHSWIAYYLYRGKKYAFQPNPGIKQIHTNGYYKWQEVGLFSWGTLSGQNLSKEIRKTIKIDGEQVGEIDSQSHLPRILHHKFGLNCQNDFYSVEKIFPSFGNSGGTTLLRNLIKKIFLILLFAENHKSALYAVNGFLQKELNQQQRNFIFNAIETEGMSSLEEIISKCISANPIEIQDCFYSKVGYLLIKISAQIMLDAMFDIVVLNRIPCLPIHDALITKEKDLQVAADCYIKSYQNFLKFKPVLNRKF